MASEKSTKSIQASIKRKETLSNLKGDYGNIAFLLLLYILQGIPIGLSSAVPLLLQNRKVSYSDQALFSFVTWPFSLKLLWAPIVDSMYWRQIGRRKSWLVPVQLGIGLFMLILSGSIKTLLSEDSVANIKPDIHLLTLIFLMLNFLAATQDIAVDGWALTMLKRRNVGYASTCNTVGQTAGFFIGNVIFLALESADFCNKYLRSPTDQQSTGLVTFEGFLYYCGLVFLIVTLLVALLKRENSSVAVGSTIAQFASSRVRTVPSDYDPEVSVRLTKRKSSDTNSDESEDEEHNLEKDLTVKETYSLLYKIIRLPSFKVFAVILLTCKIGFSAPDAVSGLKLVEAGVHKENLALLAVPMVPLQIVLPWAISRITCGPRPLDLLIKAYPFRLLFGIVFPLVVFWTPTFKSTDGTFPVHYYMMLIFIYALHQVTVYSMFVALMAFHATVSDPSIGGTYMTLLNTLANLGGNWPSTLSLWLVDKLTILGSCTQVCNQIKDNMSDKSTTILNISDPTTTLGPNVREIPKYTCETECTNLLDGYYIECAICVIVGFIWLAWGSARLRRLQSLPPASWIVSSSQSGNATIGNKNKK